MASLLSKVSWGLQQVLDLFLEDGGVSGSDVFGMDAAVAGDQKRNG